MTARELWRSAYEWLQTMLCSVLAAVLIFTFAVRIIQVDGESMRETLQDGDLLVVVNGPLGGRCRAGDLVIAARRDFGGGAPIVKRVIAVEGQTVDIDLPAAPSAWTARIHPPPSTATTWRIWTKAS